MMKIRQNNLTKSEIKSLLAKVFWEKKHKVRVYPECKLCNMDIGAIPILNVF